MGRKLEANSTNNNTIQDFPGDPMVKNPPANARDTGSIPGLALGLESRKIPYFMGATKPMGHNYGACTLHLLKPVCLQPILHNRKSHHNEKSTHCN